MPVKKVKSQKSKTQTSPKRIVKRAVKRSSKKEEPVKGSSLSASVYNIKGKAVEKITLPKEIFGTDVNEKLLAQAVRVYLANQRGGYASTKTRGEVTGSTRKIYRQKGTGRARHGGIRAPIFVGGGIVFGPKPRDFSLKLPAKMRKAALLSALSQKALDNGVKVLSGFEKIEPKTKIFADALKNMDSNLERKKVLLVTPTNSNELPNLYRAARNIEGVKIIPAQMLNTYEVLDNVAILLMKSSIDVLKKFLGGKE